MKCPYRTKKSVFRGVSHGAYRLKSNDIHEDFEDCYGEECPLYNNKTDECYRVRKERLGVQV